VDEIYEQARAAGAIGGKLIGAGGGGFIVLFAPPARHAAIRERLAKLIHVPVKFEFGGSQIIFFDREEDYSAEEQARSARTIDAFRELGH
jgi:D-glycero-alpha-D-manno-heptose-7-phosphate kinase